MSARFRREVSLQTAALFILFCATPLVWNFRCAGQQSTDSAVVAANKPALTVDEIVSRLEEKNAERQAALRKFESTRVYRVQYHGFFGTRRAESTVAFNYASPNGREFRVVSKTGSKFIIDHVIAGLIDGEKESATEENRSRTALNTKNYNFTLAAAETAHDPSEYVLNLVPKNDNKFLYRGKIWVDSNDFAVTRIEAQPAKSPSFWVKHTDVHHRYQRVDGFWLPAKNESESWIRMGGHALLSIEYKDYKIIEAAPLQAADSHADVAAGAAHD